MLAHRTRRRCAGALTAPHISGAPPALSARCASREPLHRGYRYDRFAEAVNYARLDRSRAFADPGADDAAPLERLAVPSEAELELMRTLGISYADGVFHWGE